MFKSDKLKVALSWVEALRPLWLLLNRMKSLFWSQTFISLFIYSVVFLTAQTLALGFSGDIESLLLSHSVSGSGWTQHSSLSLALSQQERLFFFPSCVRRRVEVTDAISGGLPADSSEAQTVSCSSHQRAVNRIRFHSEVQSWASEGYWCNI